MFRFKFTASDVCFSFFSFPNVSFFSPGFLFFPLFLWHTLQNMFSPFPLFPPFSFLCRFICRRFFLCFHMILRGMRKCRRRGEKRKKREEERKGENRKRENTAGGENRGKNWEKGKKEYRRILTQVRPNRHTYKNYKISHAVTPSSKL